MSGFWAAATAVGPSVWDLKETFPLSLMTHVASTCPYGLECPLLEVGDMPGALGWVWFVLCLVSSVSVVLGF